MTKTRKTAPKTSELATGKDTAILVKATASAPIAADFSNQWETFTARPAVAATSEALITVKASLGEIWEFEKETQTGKRFTEFCFDASRRIALPLLNLGWLAANKGYQYARKPETKTAVKAKWQALKTWASPKYDYEQEGDRPSELNLEVQELPAKKSKAALS